MNKVFMQSPVTISKLCYYTDKEKSYPKAKTGQKDSVAHCTPVHRVEPTAVSFMCALTTCVHCRNAKDFLAG